MRGRGPWLGLLLLGALAAFALARSDREAPRGVQLGAARLAEGRLVADEAAGGHTLDRHVGLTDRQLAERLRREPSIGAASTFVDRRTAERAVAATLDHHRGRIDRWLAGRAGADLALDLRGGADGPLGRVLLRGARAPVAATGARVVLRRRGEGGFFVLTAYPIEEER